MLLRALEWPGPGRIEAEGVVRLGELAWSLDATATELPTPEQVPGPLAVDLGARGRRLQVEQLAASLRAGEQRATIEASYQPDAETPLEADVRASGPLEPLAGVEGSYELSGRAAGALAPPELDFGGGLSASGRGPEGDASLRLPVAGSYDQGELLLSAASDDVLGGSARAALQRSEDEPLHGELHLEDARLRELLGAPWPRGSYDATFDLRRRDGRLVADGTATLSTGPDDALQAHARFDGSVDLDTGEVRGDVALDVSAREGALGLGDLDLQAQVRDGELRLSSVEGELGGARVTGQGTVDLRDWTRSQGRLLVEDVRLAELVPGQARADLHGELSGELDVGPAESERALEPLRVAFSLHGRGAGWRSVPFEGLEAVAFAGEDRVVLDRALLALAGGLVELWASRTSVDGRPFLRANLELRGLSVDAIADAFAEQPRGLGGHLSGTATAGGHLERPFRAFGQALLEVQELDVLRVPIVAQLYALLDLDDEPPGDPPGSGRAHVRLQGRELLVPRLEYFQRGVEVVARGAVADLALGAESPVAALVAASLRPQQDFEVPLPGGLQDLIRSAGITVVARRVEGTLAEPLALPVSDDLAEEVDWRTVVPRLPQDR